MKFKKIAGLILSAAMLTSSIAPASAGVIMVDPSLTGGVNINQTTMPVTAEMNFSYTVAVPAALNFVKAKETKYQLYDVDQGTRLDNASTYYCNDNIEIIADGAGEVTVSIHSPQMVNETGVAAQTFFKKHYRPEYYMNGELDQIYDPYCSYDEVAKTTYKSLEDPEEFASAIYKLKNLCTKNHWQMDRNSQQMYDYVTALNDGMDSDEANNYAIQQNSFLYKTIGATEDEIRTITTPLFFNDHNDTESIESAYQILSRFHEYCEENNLWDPCEWNYYCFQAYLNGMTKEEAQEYADSQIQNSTLDINLSENGDFLAR